MEWKSRLKTFTERASTSSRREDEAVVASHKSQLLLADVDVALILGRRCGGSSDPILQSLPGIQIWTVDLNCSCSKVAPR